MLHQPLHTGQTHTGIVASHALCDICIPLCSHTHWQLQVPKHKLDVATTGGLNLQLYKHLDFCRQSWWDVKIHHTGLPSMAAHRFFIVTIHMLLPLRNL
jgi:hypothetical protein